MKKLLKKLTGLACFALALIFVFSLAGCGAGGDKNFADYEGSFSPMAPDGDASVPPYGDLDAAGEAGKPDDSGNSGGSETPIAKQLTAAAWSDALNYEFWLGLFESGVGGDAQGATPNGFFYGYLEHLRGLDTLSMHEVRVTCNGDPVAGASVKLYRGDEVVYSAVSDSAGKAYLFGNGTRAEAASGGFIAGADIADGVTDIALTDFGACDNELEIMLVVDTTGSMSDELSFLCEELAGVVKRASSALSCNIKMGLVFYRDEGDEYVTRHYGFQDVTSQEGLNTVANNIRAQSASGGGDYPEAVDTALSEAVAADWNENSKTKLLFQVLDAPYHNGQECESRFASAVKRAAERGIRIIPVAASGLDTLGQFTMRSAALLTGGTYAFLTDDSGIGDGHELPAVGKYTVEYLSDLMVRLIKGYYTGTFDEPVDWKQAESIS